MGPSVQGRDEFQCSSAIILVNHLAGYPVSIGSDRARAFVEGVIQQLTEYSGITHVLGSVYHPQSNGALGRAHRKFNILRKKSYE